MVVLIFPVKVLSVGTRGAMDTCQKEKEKEKETDLAPGERTPKVRGVNHGPSDIAGC